MKKHILLFTFALLSTAAFAQNQTIRYQGEVQAGYAFGIGDYKIDRLSIHMINGVRFNPYFSAGLGLGLDVYNSDGETLVSLPLFVNLKGYLPVSQSVSFFASFDLGYSVALKSYEETIHVNNIPYNGKLGMKGIMYTPAIGASFKVTGNKTLNLSLGYDIKTATADVSGQGQHGSDDMKCNAIGIKLGYAF